MGKGISSARRYLPAKARVAVVCGLMFFVGGQLTLSLLMERPRAELRDLDFGTHHARLRKQLSEHRDQPLALFLGSSRTFLGFRPACLPEYRSEDGKTPLVFNFGVLAAGPLHELLILHRLLAEGVRPRWVFVEVAPQFLHVEDGLKQLPCARYPSWTDLPIMVRYSSGADPIWLDWAEGLLAPAHTFRINLMNAYTPAMVPLTCRKDWIAKNMDATGWISSPRTSPMTPEQRRLDIETTRANNAELLNHYRITGVPERALRELLDLCRREQLPTVLFVMPESPTYQSWYPPGSKEMFDDFLYTLCQEYDVSVVNGRDWLPDESFSDGHHLLVEGAEDFTRRFGREVLQPVLTGRDRSIARCPRAVKHLKPQAFLSR